MRRFGFSVPQITPVAGSQSVGRGASSKFRWIFNCRKAVKRPEQMYWINDT